MMISTKGRYALRIMIDLGQHPDEFVSSKEIADRQGVSTKYLETIARRLSKQELIYAQLGKNGGYRLTRHPAEISAGEIIKAAEGTLTPVACAGVEKSCDKVGECLTYPLWLQLEDKIYTFLNSVSLEDIMNGNI